MEISFTTNILKPWEQLNSLLFKQQALQPDISDFTQMANSLAISINHLADEQGLKPKNIVHNSVSYKIISDVADKSKHKKLFDASRENSLTIGSRFEVNELNKFRFLRNVITIDHTTLGKFDFIEVSRDAVQYWLQRLKLTIKWRPIIAEGPQIFHNEVFLRFNSKYQVYMSSLQIEFFRRLENGSLVPYDPPQWKFHLEEEIFKET